MWCRFTVPSPNSCYSCVFFQVIETTRCTQARAELALYDNDNDLAAAIDYILEHGSEIESWTEQKSKKDKKKEEEEKRPARGQPSTRGRGGYADRGGRGRGRGEGMVSRGASRGGSVSGRGRGAAVNSSGSRSIISKAPTEETSVKAADTDSVDDVADWVGVVRTLLVYTVLYMFSRAFIEEWSHGIPSIRGFYTVSTKLSSSRTYISTVEYTSRSNLVRCRCGSCCEKGPETTTAAPSVEFCTSLGTTCSDACRIPSRRGSYERKSGRG